VSVAKDYTRTVGFLFSTHNPRCNHCGNLYLVGCECDTANVKPVWVPKGTVHVTGEKRIVCCTQMTRNVHYRGSYPPVGAKTMSDVQIEMARLPEAKNELRGWCVFIEQYKGHRARVRRLMRRVRGLDEIEAAQMLERLDNCPYHTVVVAQECRV